jgi:hypothetical protein
MFYRGAYGGVLLSNGFFVLVMNDGELRIKIYVSGATAYQNEYQAKGKAFDHFQLIYHCRHLKQKFKYRQ